jgi:hypothetical protein
MELTKKQNSLIVQATLKGKKILNPQDYQNKDSIIQGVCSKCGTPFEGSVEKLLKEDFECMSCLQKDAENIQDTDPYFLALDAASYTTGVAIFNRGGQLLSHQAINIDKKKDFFVRVYELKQEIVKLIEENKITCVILEDCQYQMNPVLFKKLAMLQGVIRYTVLQELNKELITAYPDEWRSYNHIGGTKRPEQKKAAIDKIKAIYQRDISEDESESILLGKYGVYSYNNIHVDDE